MNARTLTSVLFAASVALTAVGIVRCRGSYGASSAAASGDALPKTPVQPAPVGDDSLASAAGLIVNNDPFRLSNSPPSTRFEFTSDGSSVSGATAPPPPRPVLVLKAIVGGPPWQAVIDGIPGQPAGTVAEQGQRFDKLVVRAVTRDSVVVQGPDTSWVLSFRIRS